MLPSARRLLAVSPFLLVGLAVACGGETADSSGSSGSSGGSGAGGSATAGAGGSGIAGTGGSGIAGTGGSGIAGTGGSGIAGAGGSGIAGAGGSSVVRTPKVHRAEAVACDGVRQTFDPGAPADGGAPVSCTQHEDCTDGKNGRCTGNFHDGWQCTYDLCTVDADCGGTKVCACEGGFRADNDICLTATCRVDADCGDNFCSPSLGDCGHYMKYVTYACHTLEDECIDDEDCADAPVPPSPFGGTPSCRFEQSVGHWKCSSQECAG